MCLRVSACLRAHTNMSNEERLRFSYFVLFCFVCVCVLLLLADLDRCCAYYLPSPVGWLADAVAIAIAEGPYLKAFVPLVELR